MLNYSVACCCAFVTWQIFFYSKSIFVDAKIPEEYVPYAVVGTNAVNVAMTFVTVRRLLASFYSLISYLYPNPSVNDTCCCSIFPSLPAEVCTWVPFGLVRCACVRQYLGNYGG